MTYFGPAAVTRGYRRHAHGSTGFLAIVGMLLVLCPPSRAGGNKEGGLAFILGFPRDEFNAHVKNVGWGGGGYIGYAIPRAPLLVGADLGYLTYGEESRDEILPEAVPIGTVEVNTSNNILLAHFLLRLDLASGWLRPHLDGLLGFKYLFTQTEIESENDWEDEPVLKVTDFQDVAWSYGVGGGVQVRLTPADIVERGAFLKIGEVLISIDARYLLGSEAEYLKKGSIRRTPEGGVDYDREKSRTDMIVAYLGAAIAY